MMKLAMDADCLIKLTKAGLKEPVCTAWRVCIPPTVRRETILAAPGRPDAVRIRANIAAEHLDDATAMRKLLQLGDERHLAKRYRSGAITIRKVAHRQGLSVGDALDLMQRIGIPGNVSVDDTLASRQSLQKRKPSRPS